MMAPINIGTATLTSIDSIEPYLRKLVKRDFRLFLGCDRKTLQVINRLLKNPLLTLRQAQGEQRGH
jgi:hypothetical protein